jgi:hypothetical protein
MVRLFDRWVEDFKACCLAANGWGIWRATS